MLSRLLVLITIICLPASAIAQPCTNQIQNNSFTITQATCIGTMGTLKGSTPTGGNGTYTYQWQFSQGNCGQNMFQNIPGATSIDYAIPASAGTNNCYRRMVSSGTCTSNSGTMRFEATDVTTPAPPTLTLIQPILALPTGTITISNPAPAAGISYSIDGTNYSNTTGIFALLAPGNYSVTARYPPGCVSPPQSVNLAAPAALAVTVTPATAQICTGGSATLTATGNGTSYQWLLNGTPIAGATSTTYVATQAGKYTVNATSGTTTVTSNESTVSVRPPVTFTVNTTNTGCASSTGSITINGASGGSGTGYTFSINNGTSFQPPNTFTNLASGTYQVVVKDGAGCSSAASNATVQTSAGPTATVNTTNFSCAASPGAATINASGGTAPYTYTINSGNPQSSNTFQNLTAGTYNLQVRDASGCVFTSSFTIQQNAALVAPTVSVTQPTGSQTTGTITVTNPAPATGISYSINGTTYTNTTGVFTGIASGTYDVTVRYPTGCISPARTVNVSAPTPTAATISPSSAEICTGGSVTLTVTSNATSYQWLLNGNTIPGATGTTYAATQAGRYTVNATTGTTTVTSNEAVVAVRPPVTFSVSTANTSCGSSNGSITVNNAAGGSGTGYTYSTNNGTSYQASNTFTGLAAGSYQVLVRDNAGCVSNPSTATVQTSGGLSATVNSTNFSCAASPGSATITATGGTTPYTYSINGGTAQASNSFQNLNAGNYNLQVNDASGCVFTSSFTIQQNAALVAPTVSVTQPTGSQTSGTITVTNPAPATGISYSINGTTYTNTTGVFTAVAPGTYDVTVKYPTGCISPARSVTVSAPPSPAASITPSSAQICTGGSATLTINGTGTAYQWLLNGNPINGATASTYVAQQAGTYTANVSNGSTTTPTANNAVVTVSPPVTFSFNATNASCGLANGGVTVTNVSGGSGSGYTYSINNGSSFQTSSSFTGLAAGNYQVVVKDAANCTSNATTVSIQTTSSLSATVNTTSFSCNQSQGSATITASGGTTPYTYSINNGTAQSSNTFQNLAAGNYALQVKDASGCTYSGNFTIDQSPALAAPIVTIAQPTSTQSTGSISVTSPAPAPGISYSIDGVSYTNTTGSFTGLTPGNYNVTAKYPTGCVSPARAVTITAPAPTPSNITPTSAQICAGSSVTLTINGSGTSYQWFLNGTAINGAIGSTYVAQQAGNYTANVTNGTTTTPASNTVVVTASPAITFTYTTTNASCGTATGGITVLSAAGGSGNGYNYSINNGTSFQPSNVFTGLSAGSYQVVVRDAAGCRSNPILVTLQGTSSLSATVNTTNVSCNQSPGSATVIATGGTSPYTYSLNNGTPQSSNSFSNLTAGTYNVAVRDAAGCTFTATFTIEQSAALVAPTATTIQPTCVLNTGTITVSNPAPGAGVTYSIDGVTYNNVTGVFTGLSAGIYNVTAKYPNGCISPASTITLTAAQTPTGVISPSTANICAGNSQVLTTSGGTSYQWFRNGTAISGATTATYTATQSGTYTASINNGVCSGTTSNSAIVTVNTVPSGTISPSTANICGGETATLTATGGVAYQWYRDDVPIGGATSSTYGATQAGTYTVDIVNEQGCRAKATNNAVVNVTNQPTGTITPSSAHLCPGTSATLTSTAGSAYQWFLNGTAINGATSSTYIAQQAGTYTVRIGSGNCSALATNSVVITASTPINFTTTPTNADCITPTGTLTISGVTGGSGGGYSYSINNGASFQAGTTFSNLAAGSYQVVVKDAAGCASASRTATIQTLASTLSATAALTNIPCGQTTGSATITATGGTAPYTYTITGGTPQPGNNFQNLAAGNYSVSVKDAVGCSFSVTFTVTQVVSTLTATAAVTDALCGAPAGAVTITAAGGTSPYTYSLDNGPFRTAAKFDTVGVGTHRVVVRDNAGCTFNVNFDVKRFGDAPNLIITNPPAICVGATANLRAAAITAGSDTGLTYTYWLDTTAATPLVNPIAAAAGKYFIKATSGTGCTSIKPVTVSSNTGTSGLITVSGPLTACLGSPVTLTASTGITYQWYRNDTIIPGAKTVTYLARETGVYSVAIGDSTCAVFATNKVTIQFRDCSNLPDVKVFVPTGFTPNKNGANDVLRPLFNGILELRHFKVFNRWGQQVFQTSTIGEGWDGTIKGSPQPSETYAWILEYIDNNGQLIKKSGRTLLIR